MTGLAWLARATIDVPSNMEMLFGTMFGTAAWPLGFAIHLTGSRLIDQHGLDDRHLDFMPHMIYGAIVGAAYGPIAPRST